MTHKNNVRVGNSILGIAALEAVAVWVMKAAGMNIHNPTLLFIISITGLVVVLFGVYLIGDLIVYLIKIFRNRRTP